DLGNGVFDRFRSLPIARSAPLAGRILADLVGLSASVTAALLVGLVVGFRILTGPLELLIAVGLVLDELGGGVHDVFAVVQDEQQAAVAQALDQAFGRFAGDCGHVAEQGARLADVEHGQGRVRYVQRAADRGQLDQPDAVGRVLPGGGFAGRTGLAGAARTDQGDQPVRGEQLADPAQLLVPADEAGELRGQVGPRRYRLLGAQYGEVRGGQLGAGVDAQLVGEGAAGTVVRAQGSRLPARRVQRPDMYRLRPLPQRMVIGWLGDRGQRLVGPAEAQ